MAAITTLQPSTTPTATATASTSFLSSLNFGNGLIEIAALTTLIGSSTAGDLVLGNRGAAGLVWGTISAFGTSSVIKACASAASTGWLRQMLGLRTPSSDRTVGMDLGLERKSKVAKRMRGMLDSPVGVSCFSDDGNVVPLDGTHGSKAEHNYRDVYAFDSTTSLMLSELTSTASHTDSSLKIHTHYHYAFYRPHHLRFQVLVLALSLLKSLEIYSLVLLEGGILIVFLTGIPFLFSFISGVILEVHDIITSRRPVETDGHLDLVAANPLPTTKRLGGPKKVVLGASRNPRTGRWWRFFWFTTATLQTLSIVLSYFLLGHQSAFFVLCWAGFQLAWVVLRVLIFNLSDGSHPMADRPMRGRTLEALESGLRGRIANLVMGVGVYQAHVHPRSVDAYMDDLFDAREARRLVVLEGSVAEVYVVPFTARSSSSGNESCCCFEFIFLFFVIQWSFLCISPIQRHRQYLKAISPSKPELVQQQWNNPSSDLSRHRRYCAFQCCMDLGESGSSSSSSSPSSFGYEGSSSDVVSLSFKWFLPAHSLTHGKIPAHIHIKSLPSPVARVFSARSPWLTLMRSQDGEEGSEPLFIPKGAGSRLETDENISKSRKNP
ncbi:hypothetical protein CPB84DRAFT_1960707 [Gymnopilus junonius]|uniref:Uncharacterized protein n=1 Tax=Gymnopilus junonius TaxID=109634 RepID=A0A9P5TPE3_GYMJU|nr:hypothetical protein CPB84DRAFT_1960707 [Gymnopilus junonius]